MLCAAIFVAVLLLLVRPTFSYYRGGPIYGNDFGVPGRNASYDYVVVGGGTAGLAIAMRLAEDPSLTVAVIEAGGFYEEDMGNTSVVPNLGLLYDTSLLQLTHAYPMIDWGIVTTPQLGLMNQTYHYWRGKTLGGSSALNNEVYQRGSRKSYDWWAKLVNDGSYTNIPANASVPNPSANAFSSNGGPLEVGYINFPLPFGSWAALAFKELGFQVLSNMDSGILLGSQYTTQTIAPDMTRSSSQASYLAYAFASGRRNLIVYPRTLAKRIIFNENLAASGLQVTTFGIPYTISANREIIISGGALNSPQLLMVSGIGPAATLQQYDIPVIVNSPGVGSNLWDHVLFSITYQVNTQGLGRLNNLQNFYAATVEYAANRTGQLTNTGFDYVAWEKLPNASRAALGTEAASDLAMFPSDWPELEYIIGDGSVPTNANSYASVIGGLVAPLSRGYVTISSNSTEDVPVFNPAWLTHPTDQKVAVESFKRCRKVFDTSAIQPVLIGEEISPGRNVTTDEQILAFIQQTATTIYHAACTCKMGNASDPMAVIDSHARVFGVERLRVVDASAFPILPPDHPSSTIYALAEKIAADILAGQ